MLATTVVDYEAAAQHLLPTITSVASWARPPSRWSGGRAGWIDLDADELGGGLKLKGLGRAGVGGQPATPPVDEHYDRWPGEPPDPHLGFDGDGELALLEGDPAPIGGLVLEGALREQACARDLAHAGVPAVRPAAAIRFDDLHFSFQGTSHPLGVSVTISPLHADHRCTTLVPLHPHALGPSGRPERSRLADVLGVRLRPSDDGGALDLLGAACGQLGASLRGFAEAGWYRYSAHPENVAIDDAGRAVLVDLDSCRPMAAIEVQQAALEEVRDGMSALYNLSCSFYSVDSVRSLADRTLVEREPFSGFLDGWDPETAGANAEAGRRIAAYVVDARRRLRRFSAFLASPMPEAEHLYRYVRHDRDLTFSWFYRHLYRRRLERPHAHPMPFDLTRLDGRLLRFAGRARHDHLLQIEAGR